MTRTKTGGPERGLGVGQHKEMQEQTQIRESTVYPLEREMLVTGMSWRKWPGETEAGPGDVSGVHVSTA